MKLNVNLELYLTEIDEAQESINTIRELVEKACIEETT